MEREHETADLIELGQASTETKGVEGVLNDVRQNLIPVGGISDD